MGLSVRWRHPTPRAQRGVPRASIELSAVSAFARLAVFEQSAAAIDVKSGADELFRILALLRRLARALPSSSGVRADRLLFCKVVPT